MGTLIRMKAEVVNPELPVLTEQGILPYYTGVYVNRLADKGATLTQTEINAVTAFINSLIDADVIGKIDTFYPCMGNVNVPLIGNKELEFTDVTSANTNLDFVNNKLRGFKGQNNMPNVKFSDLSTFTKGLILGGSMLSKTPTSHPSSAGIIVKLLGPNNDGSYPAVQARMTYTGSDWKYRFFDLVSSGYITEVGFNPALQDSDDQHNYSFVYGVVNESHNSDSLTYNRTLVRDTEILANVASNDIGVLLKTTDITNYYFGSSVPTYDNKIDRVVTTLAFFNEILTAPMSKAFCQALDTFTAAVGKTVSVG